MPSRLRFQESFEPISVQTVRVSPPSSPLQKKQKMSLSQTYFVAASARSKLGKEACRPDHNLRVLVGHANLLDSLMIELRDAEREQEAWFNRTVQKAQKSDQQQQQRHIRWADTIVEDEDEDFSDSDSDSDSECNEEDFEMLVPSKGLRTAPVTVTSQEVEVDTQLEDMDEDEDEDEDLYDFPALTRTESHPPGLVLDSDSDDESPPTSPPQPTFDYAQVRAAVDVKPYAEGMVDPSLYRDGFYIPERTGPLIEAY